MKPIAFDLKNVISRKGTSLTERFWGNVEKRPEPNGCWEWIGYKQRGGYGQIRINGKLIVAHRVSWEMENGNISEQLCVLHHCDNPACVRPSHLFLGTQLDNNLDMVRKGRREYPAGEDHPRAKLTNLQVKDIRNLREQGLSLEKIAKKYCVSSVTISRIVNRKSYSRT